MWVECVTDVTGWYSGWYVLPQPRTDARGKVGEHHRGAATEEHEPFDHVLELAHVPLPGVRDETLERVRRKSGDRRVRMLLLRAREEVLEQARDVVSPLAQGRDLDGD